jgi:hypothetical protein
VSHHVSAESILFSDERFRPSFVSGLMKDMNCTENEGQWKMEMKAGACRFRDLNSTILCFYHRCACRCTEWWWWMEVTQAASATAAAAAVSSASPFLP